jgi:RimJ/RimL family protein N-acetyltransferase
MLELRPATAEDEGLVLRWRNELSTRVASLSTNEISPSEHHRWFLSKLADPKCALLIIEEDGRPVGQVRLDRVSPAVAEISIGLAADVRGRRLGRQALRRVVLDASTHVGAVTVRALIRRENASSLAAFTAAGFRVVGEDDAGVVELLHGPDVDALPG